MNIRNFLLVVLYINLNSLATAQKAVAQPKQIILQIDTIIIEDVLDFFIQTPQRKILWPYIDDDSCCKVNKFNKSLTCKMVLENDSSTVRIALDRRGGYLELSNVQHQRSDTVRISKFIVYDRPYCDTHRTETAYWYEQADTLGECFKTTQKYSVSKVKSRNLVPMEIKYQVNGETYSCTTLWEKDTFGAIKQFHGHGRTGLFKGRRPYYFHGTMWSTLTVNVAYLKLKGGP